LHWSTNLFMVRRRESESMVKLEEEIVTRRGIGCGKVESKADWESKKLRGPK
jgi:hypothetical protein